MIPYILLAVLVGTNIVISVAATIVALEATVVLGDMVTVEVVGDIVVLEVLDTAEEAKAIVEEGIWPQWRW